MKQGKRMKATLIFNLPEESSEFNDAQMGTKYSICLTEVRNRLLRPARKHGYSNPELQKHVETYKDMEIFINLLEEEFNSILSEYEIYNH